MKNLLFIGQCLYLRKIAIKIRDQTSGFIWVICHQS